MPDDRDGRPAPAAELASVLVVADPTTWTRAMTAYLSNEGFHVLVDESGSAVSDHRARAVDVAVIDLHLSAVPATQVCATWRARSKAPILAVAHTSDETTVLAAFAAGADHFASMAMTERQFLAHLRSLLRRAPRRAADASGPEASPISLDAEACAATVQGTSVQLTKEEYHFLELLIERPGRVIARNELSAALAPTSSDRAVDFFVRRLREKIESIEGRRRIVVVRGVGFRIDVGQTSEPEVPA